MPTTKQIQRDDWERYFDSFTQRHLRDDGVPKAATIELLSPRLGDQLEAVIVPLIGLSYDPKSGAFEVLLADRDHFIYALEEIWVVEEDGGEGFVSSLELVRHDGSKDIIYVRRSGPPALRHDQAPMF
jgi:hypothetical protein